MPGETIKDNSDELMGKFKDVLDKWSNPADFPDVKWTDVVEARLNVVHHQWELAKTGQFQARQIERQGRGQQEAQIPS